MSQDHLIKLACAKCKTDNYFTNKNRKSVERKLDLQKFCNSCRKRTSHKEKKI